MKHDRIHFLVPKGMKGKYKRFAKRVHKLDLTHWLLRLMTDDVARHEPSPPAR